MELSTLRDQYKWYFGVPCRVTRYSGDACHLPYPGNCCKQRNSGVTHSFCVLSSRANCQTDQSRLYQASRKVETSARQPKRRITDFTVNDPLPAIPTTLLTTFPLFYVLLPSKSMFKHAAHYSEVRTFCEGHFGEGQSQHSTTLKEEKEGGERGGAHQENSLFCTE